MKKFSKKRGLKAPKKKLSEEEINDEVKTLILTAQDTSSTIISTVLLLLAMHKEIQQKAVDELQRIFGKILDASNPDYEKFN